MDKKIMFQAVDKFLDELSKHGKSDVKCPFCGTPLEYYGDSSAYEVKCHTPDCIKETFRGI